MKQVLYSYADKYVNAENYSDIAPFAPYRDTVTDYGVFYTTGEYVIYRGFLFSANFPAINTDDSRRAAMVHDFFYELMKRGVLSREHRYDVDYLFYNQLLEDGMIPLRAWYWFRAVREFGDNALDSPYPKIYSSPNRNPLVAGSQLNQFFK